MTSDELMPYTRSLPCKSNGPLYGEMLNCSSQRSPTSGSHWSHIRRWGTATSTTPPAILSLGPLPASLLVSERRLARSLLRGSISAGAGSRPPSFPCPAPRASLIYKPTLLLRELISVRMTWRTLMMSRSKQGSSKAVCRKSLRCGRSAEHTALRSRMTARDKPGDATAHPSHTDRRDRSRGCRRPYRARDSARR